MRNLKLFAISFLLLAGFAHAQDKMPAGVQSRKTDAGMAVFADAKGMTLYNFGRDAEGKSNCNGQCAMNWPPLAAAADAAAMGDWTIVTRDDGSKQWAFKGKPVYTYAKDTKPGDATGNGAGNGNWKAVTP
jgi:predicted lipoprotein with Yx(FWY)xxD motif